MYNCGPCSRCGDVQLQSIYFLFTMSLSITKKKNQGTKEVYCKKNGNTSIHKCILDGTVCLICSNAMSDLICSAIIKMYVKINLVFLKGS